MARVTLADIKTLSDHANATLADIRDGMLEPFPRKTPPTFSSSQVAALCGVDAERMRYLLKKPDAPVGEQIGRRRVRYSLIETRRLIAQHSGILPRPNGARGATIACVNFKGGSTKTTTAFNLAQGLTLRGRRVLLVDLDPQASATTLCGILPPLEVDEGETAQPITWGDDAPEDLRYAVRPTYWDGLDLIPAMPLLYNAEWLLVSRVSNPKSRWWDLLNAKLEPLRADYDVIIIDTQPALSLMGVLAAYAADGLLMPLPPETLDYASSTSFWQMTWEILEKIHETLGVEKDFAFLKVLVSRSDASLSASLVRRAISTTYGQYLMSREIPKSQVTTNSAVQFGTVHDVSEYEGGAATYHKIRDAYDEVVREIDDQVLIDCWGVNT